MSVHTLIMALCKLQTKNFLIRAAQFFCCGGGGRGLGVMNDWVLGDAKLEQLTECEKVDFFSHFQVRVFIRRTEKEKKELTKKRDSEACSFFCQCLIISVTIQKFTRPEIDLISKKRQIKLQRANRKQPFCFNFRRY